MKSQYRLVKLILCSLICLSCAAKKAEPARSVVVFSSYRHQHYHAKTLFITSPQNLNFYYYRRDLSGKPHVSNALHLPLDKYRNILTASLLDSLMGKSQFRSVSMGTIINMPDPRYRGHMGRREVSLRVPQMGQKIEFQEGTPDFVLILDQLDIEQMDVLKEDWEFGLSHYRDIDEQDMQHHLIYTFWDNQRMKIAAFGETIVESRTMRHWDFTQEEWGQLVSGLADQIFQRTPFLLMPDTTHSAAVDSGGVQLQRR